MKVIFGDDFGQKFKHFPKTDKVKIFEFASHIEQFGFVGLQGRNKSLDNVPKMTQTGWQKFVMLKNIIFGIITLVFLITNYLKMAIILRNMCYIIGVLMIKSSLWQ